MNPNNYSEYAAIAKHIHRANIARLVDISQGIAGFIADVWNAIKAPPAILPIDRRRESRTGIPRNANRLAHR